MGSPDPASTSCDPGTGGSGVVARLLGHDPGPRSSGAAGVGAVGARGVHAPSRCIAVPAGYDIRTSPNEPKATHANAANGGPREQAIKHKLADARISLGHLIVRDFPRSFRGYNRGAVRKHLEQLATWLSLSGLDDLVRERFNEQDPLGRQLRIQAETEAEQLRAAARREADHHRQLRAQAESDAEQVRADACRDVDQHMEQARRVLEAAHQDAEGIRARARREADALLADARARAAAELRGPLAKWLHRGAPDR
jgi:hypothetical protein